MIDVREWEQKKKKIEKAKEEVSINKGKRESVLTRMEKDFGCKTLDEAEEKLNELREKKRKLEQKLSVMLEELDAYDWNI
jgi:CHASE3 domain sensor protein